MVEVYALIAIILGGMLLVLWSMLIVAGRADEAAERAERSMREAQRGRSDEEWERELAALMNGGYTNEDDD